MTPPPHIVVGGFDLAFSMTSSSPVAEVMTVETSHIGLIPKFLKSQGRNGAADTVVI